MAWPGLASAAWPDLSCAASPRAPCSPVVRIISTCGSRNAGTSSSAGGGTLTNPRPSPPPPSAEGACGTVRSVYRKCQNARCRSGVRSLFPTAWSNGQQRMGSTVNSSSTAREQARQVSTQQALLLLWPVRRFTHGVGSLVDAHCRDASRQPSDPG
eukprot:364435-Chlamydomonas_euryale.AAC.4